MTLTPENEAMLALINDHLRMRPSLIAAIYILIISMEELAAAINPDKVH